MTYPEQIFAILIAALGLPDNANLNDMLLEIERLQELAGAKTGDVEYDVEAGLVQLKRAVGIEDSADGGAAP